MRCRYPDKDLSQRLDSTICRYEGIPVFVRYAGRNALSLYTVDQPNKKAIKEIAADDPLFDISAVPLGYVQYSARQVAHLSRRANRIYKQGLSADVVNCDLLVRTGTEPIIGTSSVLYSKAFEESVLGMFTGLDDAIRQLRDGDVTAAKAISRDVALKFNQELKMIVVYYKGSEVGWIPPGTREVIVPSTDKGWVVSRFLSGFTWEVK